MNQKRRLLVAFCLCMAILFPLKAEDLKRIISLSGYWQFSIGDDPAWASPDYNDKDWDHIVVPGAWENQGYNDYNGYAWYRKTINISSLPANAPIYLILGRIDDVDEVYINGKWLGRNGTFPPAYNTAYGNRRRYLVPDGYLNENGENTIAIRVYDSYRDGGVVDGNVGFFIDYDMEYLDLNLTGRWKFHTGDDKEWKNTDYPDSDWKRLNVPASWDGQGYSSYDGIAWYRVSFRVPADFMRGDFYLCLGKIDDIDEVYLNGKYIGGVYDLNRDGDYRHSGMEYNARRLYKISSNMLQYGAVNTLAIRVNDLQQIGGIYEGPIGFMSSDNFRRYRNKHASSLSFWEFIFNITED